MTVLILALGWRSTLSSRLWLLSVIALATVGFLAVGVVLIDGLGLPASAVQGLSWGAWLYWLAVIFPRSHLSEKLATSLLPYRRVFLREILPGVACSFAQLLRPAVEGALSGASQLRDLDLIIPGSLLVAAGATLILSGVRALGIARTLFVHEYLSLDTQLTRSSIYSYIRHPLFVGGIAASAGLALCVGTPQALELTVLNACALPAYVLLEDRRCCRVIGDSYIEYRSTVGAVLPRIRRLGGDRRPALGDQPVRDTPQAHRHGAAESRAQLDERAVEELGQGLSAGREPCKRSPRGQRSKHNRRRRAAR